MSVFEEIKILSEPLVGIPTDDDVAHSQNLLGYALPQSYVEFTKKFGYGLLGELIIIFSPISHYPETLAGRCSDIRNMFSVSIDADLVEYEPDGTPDLLRRLIPFGVSENGAVVAWDPSVLDESSEYPIYVVGAKMLRVASAGNSMEEFVASLFDERVRHVLGPGYQPLPKIFEPSRFLREWLAEREGKG